ncbi:hypothetical protein O8H94_001018 [Escherichia coli O157]|nr:hypothetical protein [Salmonella enterica subsp. enterica serovar Bovismorbificans]EFD5176719.1 hypothetical protein [Escherichia coli]EKH6014456.1 hypothetical protein [Escherichia coli O157]EKH6024486.1 hypothetical protein [Escherichia coli O157]EKH6093922.1 hypothetical protein [Escherichia coli O157]
MNENNCELVPEERLVAIRDYFLADEENKPFFVFSDNKHQATCELAAAEGMRDALVYRLEAKRSVASDMTEIDNAIMVVDRRYDELLTEYEKGSQTVILH